MSDLPYYLDRKSLADLVGLSRVTIDRMREDGVAEIKDEGKLYFRRDDVLAWMEKRVAA